MDYGDKLQGKRGVEDKDLPMLRQCMRTRNVSRETPAKATGFLVDRALPMRLNAALTMPKSARIGAAKSCQAQKFWRESGGSGFDH